MTNEEIKKLNWNNGEKFALVDIEEKDFFLTSNNEKICIDTLVKMTEKHPMYSKLILVDREGEIKIDGLKTVYVLLEDSDGTTRSKNMPFGVAVTSREEAERYVKEGGVGYTHSYEELRVFENKDKALNWKFNKL